MGKDNKLRLEIMTRELKLLYGIKQAVSLYAGGQFCHVLIIEDVIWMVRETIY